jgi:hypothetical protein
MNYLCSITIQHTTLQMERRQYSRQSWNVGEPANGGWKSRDDSRTGGCNQDALLRISAGRTSGRLRAGESYHRLPTEIKNVTLHILNNHEGGS